VFRTKLEAMGINIEELEQQIDEELLYMNDMNQNIEGENL
jgi:hypothetical protein